MPVVSPFIGLAREFFDNALEASPFGRLQGHEFEADAPVAAPADDALLNGERDFLTRYVDAKFKGGAGMHGYRAQDTATAQGQIDDIALPADAVDRTEGTSKVNWKTRMVALVHDRLALV